MLCAVSSYPLFLPLAVNSSIQVLKMLSVEAVPLIEKRNGSSVIVTSSTHLGSRSPASLGGARWVTISSVWLSVSRALCVYDFTIFHFRTGVFHNVMRHVAIRNRHISTIDYEYSTVPTAHESAYRLVLLWYHTHGGREQCIAWLEAHPPLALLPCPNEVQMVKMKQKLRAGRTICW